MKTAIYKIKNIINSDVYVGRSTNPKFRWQSHCANSKSRLSNAIRKFGKQNFEFSILETCSKKEASKKEASWIKILRPSYNKHQIVYRELKEFWTVKLTKKDANGLDEKFKDKNHQEILTFLIKRELNSL